MFTLRFRSVVTALGAWTALSCGAADGLQVRENAAVWPAWQTRLSVSALAPAGTARAAGANALLLGDYYFAGPGFGAGNVGGGFRATSGLVVGSRSAALSTPGVASVSGSSSTLWSLHGNTDQAADSTSGAPYVGLGYTGLFMRSGWGFSADVGIVGPGAGNGLRISAPATPSLDDRLRDLRLTPVVQLGVSYAF